MNFFPKSWVFHPKIPGFEASSPSYWAALDDFAALILPGNDDEGASRAPREFPKKTGIFLGGWGQKIGNFLEVRRFWFLRVRKFWVWVERFCFGGKNLIFLGGKIWFLGSENYDFWESEEFYFGKSDFGLGNLISENWILGQKIFGFGLENFIFRTGNFIWGQKILVLGQKILFLGSENFSFGLEKSDFWEILFWVGKFDFSGSEKF